MITRPTTDERSLATMMDDSAVAAGRGATLLDEKWPNWWAKIDTKGLSMDNTEFCILGQLYSGTRLESDDQRVSSIFGVCRSSFGIGVEVLGLSDEEVESYGFDAVKGDHYTSMEKIAYRTLQYAWVKEIRRRQELAKSTPIQVVETPQRDLVNA